MSEFACANGHLIPSGKMRCPECGAKLATMDGMSSRELNRQERIAERNFKHRDEEHYPREHDEDKEETKTIKNKGGN